MSEPDFLGLARLSHDAFASRQRYEWRINFSLWTALGLIVYAASKDGVHVFRESWEAVVFGSVVLTAYIVYQWLIGIGHNKDKRWKHYYLKKAEGNDNVTFESIKEPSCSQQILWAIPPTVFTAAILTLAGLMLMRLPDRSASPAPAQAAAPAAQK